MWRGIDSAPKDGTHILIAMGSGVVWLARWRSEREPGMKHWSENKVTGWTRVGFADLSLEPSQWKPLPEPPLNPKPGS